VLFEQRWAPAIRSGRVTVTFRRWKRRQAVPGRRYRTPVGLLDVIAVDEVDEGAVTDAEAADAGYPSAAALVADLRPGEGTALFRVRFRYVDEPDPRDQRAADGVVTDEDVTELDRRLERLDRASPDGPWTIRVLDLIAAHPAVRAGDLAELEGMARDAFKVRVRKLKSLSLTVSLDVGYRLSARGEAYRARSARS
jgi:hypothetical protein